MSEISRREFLNLGKGLAAFLATKPRVDLRDLLPPDVKDIYTDAEWYTIRQPIERILQVLGFRQTMGLSDGVEQVNLEPIAGASIDERRPLRREFPEFDLAGVREGLKSPGHPETAIPDIAGFMFPYLDKDYILPVSVEEGMIDPKTGGWQRVGPLRPLNETLTMFFPDAQKLVFGRGILGEAWTLKTKEFHSSHTAEITWAVRRAVPTVEIPVRPNDNENLLANVNSTFTQMFITREDGKTIQLVTPQTVVFVPVEFSFKPIKPPPPEVNA